MRAESLLCVLCALCVRFFIGVIGLDPTGVYFQPVNASAGLLADAEGARLRPQALAGFLLAAALVAAPTSDPLANLPIQVEIFEQVPTGAPFQLEGLQPTDRYSEPAFAFVRTPTKFSSNAIPTDRSTPFVLRASYARQLPAGRYHFRLRARGAATFLIDGQTLLTTKPQKPNTSGDDPVPPPVERGNSPLRPASYPHQDATVEFVSDGEKHTFTLMAVIGGKGLYPTPGELAVSFGPPGTIERLLGPDGSPQLTDAAWEAYVTASQSRHTDADIYRRRNVSQSVVAQWEKRHDNVRQYLATRPAPAAPAVASTARIANDIDRFIAARLDSAKVAPQQRTSDLEFLRRVTLDVTGLIPTAEEVKAYLATPAAVRRKKAIDRLLENPSWADHWVSYWQDVLAENPGILKPDLNNTGPFRLWLHQSFADNIAFDRLVTELIEMQGSVVLGGPAAFAQATLNDAPMAAKADIVAQAFLGMKMGCARCHDAPFHPFKQKDLFSLAAMLNGKDLKLPATSTVPMIEGGRKPVVTVALKPGEAISPDWPFKEFVTHDETGLLPNTGSLPTRRAVAARIIAPENDRFAQVIANRVWKRYMGVGIVEPADDWSRAKPSHPELLQYLGHEFMRSGYDLKHLARLILSSDTYQREAAAGLTPQTGAEHRLFAGPARRSMTAEQIVDSLHLAAGKSFDCEELNLNPAGDRSAAQFLNLGKPARAWQMTALSNERDRPALALPIAQSAADVMSIYGWRQSRQNAATSRDDAPSPMQTLILANGVLGTRLVRLSDDSYFTEAALKNTTVEQLITDAFLRILSRPPSAAESKTFIELLKPHFADRKVAGAEAVKSGPKTDSRVSWSNHLSSEATLIRLEEEKKLRMGEEPTKRLKPAFRERFEDTLWALVNSPEFVMVP